MVTTLGRLDSMITWSYEVTWLIKKRYISTSTRPITAKLYKVGVHGKGPPSIKSFWHFDDWSCYHVADEKRYISTSARPMTTKFNKVVDSNASLLSIWSQNLLITWSHNVTWEWQMFFKFTFTRPFAIRLDKHVQPQCHIFLQSRGYVSSRDKMNFIISLLPRGLLLLKLTRWWLVMRNHSKNSDVLWS